MAHFSWIRHYVAAISIHNSQVSSKPVRSVSAFSCTVAINAVFFFFLSVAVIRCMRVVWVEEEEAWTVRFSSLAWFAGSSSWCWAWHRSSFFGLWIGGPGEFIGISSWFCASVYLFWLGALGLFVVLRFSCHAAMLMLLNFFFFLWRMVFVAKISSCFKIIDNLIFTGIGCRVLSLNFITDFQLPCFFVFFDGLLSMAVLNRVSR